MTAPPPDGIERLVVVGCSWGGLAAVGSLLDHLPTGIPIAVVVAQHRSPAPSAFTSLIGAHTSWPVCEAEDKEHISPGTVHVAPGGYHLLVDGPRFALTTEAPVRHSRPSIDVLFESAAESFTDRVVALVLTGANDDGAVGVRRVVHRGGVVVVQDPETADRREMPDAAIAAGVPVHVARTEAMGPLLAGLITYDGVPTGEHPSLGAP